MTDETLNPGVEGSGASAPVKTPGPDPALVAAVEARLAQCEGPDWTRRETALLILSTVRAWDAVEARVAKGGCPVERRDCDGPGTYYCDSVLWHSACRRYFEQRREAGRG